MSDKSSTPAQRPDEPKGGTIIAERYQIDKLIARGGMAAVYLAHHVKLNRPVALKVLSPPPDADDLGAFEERFRLEAETLAALDHPNIVILHDFGDLDDGRFFLAMEYIPGPRLSDVLRDGPLPCERALRLITQIAGGLRYAHRRGVVHRDLKPSNLLIRQQDDGTELMKVVDFGLVKLTENDQSITRAGLILGSPHCMAPEQVKGQPVDHRADIYAIGILLFRTLTGQYPFHGPNSAATMIAHLNQPVPSFFSVAPDLVVPEGLEEAVRKCLEKDPIQRFDSMQDVIEALAACMEVPPENFRSVSQTHSSIQRQVGGNSPTNHTRTLIIGIFSLLALAIVAMALVTFQWLRTGATPPEATAIEAPVEAPPPAEPEPTQPAAPPPSDEAETPSEAPSPSAEVAPAPAPAPVTAPAPVAPKPAPAPAPVVPTPEPEAPTDEDEAPTAPDGYMGVPDDLFGE